jgi:hypothetical protein
MSLTVPTSPALRWVTAALLFAASGLSVVLPFFSATLLTIAVGAVSVIAGVSQILRLTGEADIKGKIFRLFSGLLYLGDRHVVWHWHGVFRYQPAHGPTKPADQLSCSSPMAAAPRRRGSATPKLPPSGNTSTLFADPMAAVTTTRWPFASSSPTVSGLSPCSTLI